MPATPRAMPDAQAGDAPSGGAAPRRRSRRPGRRVTRSSEASTSSGDRANDPTSIVTASRAPATRPSPPVTSDRRRRGAACGRGSTTVRTVAGSGERPPSDRAGPRRHSSTRSRDRTRAMKAGAPRTPRTTPTWSSARGDDHPADDVGDEQHDRGQDRGVRQDPAVVRSAQQPGKMGHDQPDEDDRPARRGRRAAQHATVANRTNRVRRTALPERDGDVLAEGQAVQRPTAGQGHDRPDER